MWKNEIIKQVCSSEVATLLGIMTFVIPFLFKVKIEKENGGKHKITKWGYVFGILMISLIAIQYGKTKIDSYSSKQKYDKAIASKDSIIANQEEQLIYLNQIQDIQNSLDRTVSRIEDINNELIFKTSNISQELQQSQEELEDFQNSISNELSFVLQLKINMNEVEKDILNATKDELSNLFDTDNFAQEFFNSYKAFSFKLIFDNYLNLSCNPEISLEKNYTNSDVPKNTSSNIQIHYIRKDNCINITLRDFILNIQTNRENILSYNDICNKDFKLILLLKTNPSRTISIHKKYEISRFAIKNQLGQTLKFNGKLKRQDLYNWHGKTIEENCWN